MLCSYDGPWRQNLEKSAILFKFDIVTVCMGDCNSVIITSVRFYNNVQQHWTIILDAHQLEHALESAPLNSNLAAVYKGLAVHWHYFKF